MSDGLEDAWKETEAKWSDESAHSQLLAQADVTDQLPELARRYRAARDAGGDKAERAQAMLDLITARALGRLASAPKSEVPSRSRIEWIALGVSVVLGAAALWQMLRVM